MILLLTQNSIQERTLGMFLKLKGYSAHVVADEHEAINLIKNVPTRVRGIVIGGTGCQRTLAGSIEAFSRHRVRTPIVVAHPSNVMGTSAAVTSAEGLNLSVCFSGELPGTLEKLFSQNGTERGGGIQTPRCEGRGRKSV